MRFFSTISRHFSSGTPAAVEVPFPPAVLEGSSEESRPVLPVCNTLTSTTSTVIITRPAAKVTAALGSPKEQQRRMWRRFFKKPKANAVNGPEAASVSIIRRVKNRKSKKAEIDEPAAVASTWPVVGAQLHKDTSEANSTEKLMPNSENGPDTEGRTKKRKFWRSKTQKVLTPAILSSLEPGWEKARIAEAGMLCQGKNDSSLFKAYRYTVDCNPRCELPELVEGIVRYVDEPCCLSVPSSSGSVDESGEFWDATHGAVNDDEAPAQEEVVELTEENFVVKSKIGSILEPAAAEPTEILLDKNADTDSQTTLAVAFCSQEQSSEPAQTPRSEDDAEENELDSDTSDFDQSESETSESESEADHELEPKSGPGFLRRWGSKAVHIKRSWRLRRREKATAQSLASEQKKLRLAECERSLNGVLSRARAQGFEKAQTEWAKQKETEVTMEKLRAECQSRTPQAVYAARAVGRVTAAFDAGAGSVEKAMEVAAKKRTEKAAKAAARAVMREKREAERRALEELKEKRERERRERKQLVERLKKEMLEREMEEKAARRRKMEEALWAQNAKMEQEFQRQASEKRAAERQQKERALALANEVFHHEPEDHTRPHYETAKEMFMAAAKDHFGVDAKEHLAKCYFAANPSRESKNAERKTMAQHAAGTAAKKADGSGLPQPDSKIAFAGGATKGSAKHSSPAVPGFAATPSPQSSDSPAQSPFSPSRQSGSPATAANSPEPAAVASGAKLTTHATKSTSQSQSKDTPFVTAPCPESGRQARKTHTNPPASAPSNAPVVPQTTRKPNATKTSEEPCKARKFSNANLKVPAWWLERKWAAAEESSPNAIFAAARAFARPAKLTIARR